MNFKASWMMRGSQVELTSPGELLLCSQVTPNPLLPSQPELKPCHWVWLNVLKVSSRNWNVECSPANQGKLKFFISAISQLFLPGPVSMLRPMFPNILGSPFANSSLKCG